MFFRTFIAPAFVAMTAIQPVAAIQQIPAGFQFITDSTEGDLYWQTNGSFWRHQFHQDVRY